MKGFILAGGEGTRLRPLTLEIPKPLLPVYKKPVLNYLVELYLKYGIKDIKINIQKKHRPDFKKWRKLYFPTKKIRFVVEDKPSGTLTPLKKAGAKWFSQILVVSNGDELKKIDLKKMEKWHEKKKALVTIGLAKVKDPKNYGSVKIRQDRIIKFAEKTAKPLSPYINAGIYMMSPEVKKYFPQTLSFKMLEKYLFPKLAKKNELFGYKFKGKWQDVGTWERWELAIKNWTK